ncbi:MAG: metallophosphoesterase [Rectinemataceae bacterium]|nr:metallophosphoesterase [Rectinemataceae bacterium]
MIPEADSLRWHLETVRNVLDSEDPNIRPRDASGLPGGLVILKKLPTILVPDLHGRVDFLSALLDWIPRTDPPGTGPTVRELLTRGEINIVCLGDGINTEGTVEAASRWHRALSEYFSHWASRSAMDEEMTLSLGVMLLVMDLKISFPAHVHFLKGNHDNLADRIDHGDRHFYKYASESIMGASWFEKTYGVELLESWRAFEISLPVVAAGSGLAIPPASNDESAAMYRSGDPPVDTNSMDAVFAASHAEPAFPMTCRDIVGYRDNPELVHALTWTDNDASLPGSVRKILKNLATCLASRASDENPASPPFIPGLWFSGHRHVQELYRYRADGLLVQFHHPRLAQFAYLQPGQHFDPDIDIVRLCGFKK